MSTSSPDTSPNTGLGHGRGTDPVDFSSVLDLLRSPAHKPEDLARLAELQVSAHDAVSDGPDPEENLYIPAGYTYFGQFIDHDLTLDTTSTLDTTQQSLDPSKPRNDPSNIRSPRLDLDSLYGTGPDDQPFLYAQADTVSADGKRDLYKNASLILAGHDLPRSPNGRALIGDKRNDENSIVNQIHQVFIKFHNQVVRKLVEHGETAREGALFKLARDQVRWAYQTIVKQDFLPRIVEHTTLNSFTESWEAKGDRAYLLYKNEPEKRRNLPREFVVAAFRFGHSLVRTGYRLNGSGGDDHGVQGTRLPIFTPSDAGEQSLVGFDPLPTSHVIDDWGRFFPPTEPKPGGRFQRNVGETFEASNGYDGKVRLQYAYKIDPSLADPLGALPPKVASSADVPPEVRPKAGQQPSLSLLNLLRGNNYLIQCGQAFEPIVGSKLDKRYLVTRQKIEGKDGGPATYIYTPIDPAFQQNTPLWFYILAEAQRPVVDLWHELQAKGLPLTEDDLKNSDLSPKHPEIDRQRGTIGQLGPVGGQIVAEVFYGLLDSDPDSIHGRGKGKQLVWGAEEATFTTLLKFTGLTIS